MYFPDSAPYLLQPFNYLQHTVKRKMEDRADHEHSVTAVKITKPYHLSSSALSPNHAPADLDESTAPMSPCPPSSLSNSRASSSASAYASSSSSTPSQPVEQLDFFVRLLSQGSLVIHARPTDTVNSVIEWIASVTGMPTFDQRLIYCGRQLCGESTLLCSGVKKDATLYLTARLRSTDQPKAWKIANDLMSSICFFSGLSRDVALVRQYNNIDRLIKHFFTSTLLEANTDSDKITAYLEVFTSAGLPSALVKLYLSPIIENRAIAENAIRLFLTSNAEFLPESVHLQCAPIVLTFCKILASAVGQTDRLYVGCRSTLARLLKDADRLLFSAHWKTTELLLELHLFIVELVGVVDAALSSENLLISDVILTDLSNFLTAIHHAIQDWKAIKGPISENLFNRQKPRYENGIGWLHELFIKLLNKVGLSLKRVENIIDKRGQAHCESQFITWSQLLLVLTVVKVFSKIFEGADRLLHTLLLERRRMLNILLRHARMDPKFRWFLRYKDVTDFETRRNLVLMLLSEGKEEDELHEMLIDRSQLLSDSFEYIGQVDATALHGGLFMEFKNEEATGPGVLREWFCILCKAIFNPQNPLFLPCPHDQRRFFPNPASSVDPLHLKYFSFSGRVIALALMHKVQVGIVFDRVFFLQLAGKSVTLEDVRDADPILYKSCKQILEMDANLLDSDALALTFAREVEMLGSRRTVELCPGGKNIIVHSRNREEYVNLLIKHCFVTSVSEQISHFARGFGDILSNSKHQKLFFDCLDIEDFDRILGGSTSFFDVKDWKKHTNYNGYKAKDNQICWFWKIVESMSEEQRRVLLFFWTSIKYLPVDSFGGLASKLYIYKSSASQDSLPTSQTCFYRLCLPAYNSKSIMRDRLHLITQEHVSCSFGTS